MEKNNNFKEAFREQSPPPLLKKNVKKNITFLRFVTSVVDLYTDKASKTLTEFLK